MADQDVDVGAVLKKTARPPAKAAPAPQEESKPRPGVTGFAEDFLTDTFDTFKGIANSIVQSPFMIAKGVKDITDMGGWGDIASDPSLVYKPAGELGHQLLVDAVEPVKKLIEGDFDYFRKKPVSNVLLPLLNLVDFGAGSASRLARLAGGKTAAELARLGRTASALDKVVHGAEYVRNLPSRLANKALVEPTMRAFGINPKVRAAEIAAHSEAEARMIQKQKALQRDYLDHVSSLTDAERAEMDDRVVLGGKPAASPKAENAAKRHNDLVDREMRPFALANMRIEDEATKLMRPPTEAELDRVVNAKRVAKQYERGIVPKPAKAADHEANLARSQAEIDAMPPELRPHYRPSYHPTDYGHEGLMDLFEPTSRRIGRVASFEHYTGALGAEQNPAVWAPKMVHGYLEAEKNFRYMGNVYMNPVLAPRGIVEGGSYENAAIPTVYKKYLADPENVRGALVARGALPDQVRDVVEMELHPTAKRAMMARIYQPSGWVRRVLDKYDKVLSLFKMSATLPRPSYHLAARVIGPAILSAVLGEDLALGRRLIPHLPDALRSIGPMGEKLGMVGRVFRKPNEFLEGVLEMRRAGIFTRKAATDLYRVGAATFDAAEKLDTLMPKIMAAPRELADLNVRMQALGETLARQSVPMREAEEAVQKAQERLHFLRDAEATARRPLTDIEARMAQHGAEVAQVRANMVRLQYATDQAELELNLALKHRDSLRPEFTATATEMAAARGDLPRLTEMNRFAREAALRANMLHGSFLELGPFERAVFVRIVPFGVWTKNVTALAFRLPFIAPKAAFSMHRYAEAMQALSGDPGLPDYMKAYTPAAAMENGALLWVRHSSLGHQGSLAVTHFGQLPIPRLAAFWETNPLIAFMFDEGGGHRVPLTAGDKARSIGDGSIYTVDQDGKLVPYIRQTWFITALEHLFPPVQMIQSVLATTGTVDYDAFGMPHPLLDVSGQPKNPKPLWERLMTAAGLPVMERSRQDIVNGQIMHYRRAILELRKKYRTADPDTRAQIAQALTDLSKTMVQMRTAR